MSKFSFTCENATSHNLKDIVSIHKEFYPKDHFTKFLSEPLLIGYYGLFLDNDDCTFSVIRDAGTNKIVGFVLFGKNDEIAKQISYFKSKNKIDLIFELIRNPVPASLMLVNKVFNIFDKCEEITESNCIILSIVSNASKPGIGKDLIEFIASQLESSDVIGLYVKAKNRRAVNFYFRSGFVVKAYCKGQYYMEKSI